MQCEKLKTYMETGRVVFLPVRTLRPNPAQPRVIFEEAGLRELASSIRLHGILQPLTVRRVNGVYELVAGERRLRAAKLAGLTEVPCLLVNMDEGQSTLAALVENLQRRDLDFIEEAQGISRLIRQYGLSQEQAALQIGKSQSAVANKLRLLRHSNQVLDRIREGGLTERHARALLKLEGEEEKLEVLERIIARTMTVSQTEKYIESLLRGQKKGAPERVDVRAFLRDLTENLAKIQSAGVPAVSQRSETDREITLTITIPK